MRMIRILPYLNFDGQAEEAFNFYKSVFGGEFETFQRFAEVPESESMPEMPEAEANRMMHVSLPLAEGVSLMGSDIMPSMGHTLHVGNNMYVSVHPDSKEEGERLFLALSEEGSVEMAFEKQFWGDWYGAFTDKFGVQWMINVHKEA